MCQQCSKKPVYEFTNKRKLGSRCFVNYFQKKVLYTIRKFGMIRNGDVIGYFSGGGFRYAVLESVLKMFAEKANVKLVNSSNIKTKVTLKQIARRFRLNKLALPFTIDITSENILDEIINGDFEDTKWVMPVEELGKKSKIIKPLYLFSDEEVLLYAKLRVLCFDSCHYAKLRKLKFRKTGNKKNKISEFLDEVEEKHPEVKRAVVNGYLGLKE